MSSTAKNDKWKGNLVRGFFIEIPSLSCKVQLIRKRRNFWIERKLGVLTDGTDTEAILRFGYQTCRNTIRERWASEFNNPIPNIRESQTFYQVHLELVKLNWRTTIIVCGLPFHCDLTAWRWNQLWFSGLAWYCYSIASHYSWVSATSRFVESSN